MAQNNMTMRDPGVAGNDMTRVGMPPEGMTPTDWSGEVRYADAGAMQQQNMMRQWDDTGAVGQGLQRTGAGMPYRTLAYNEMMGQYRQPLDMENPLTQGEMASPSSNAEAYYGSLKSLLSRNLNQYVLVTFRLGDGETVIIPGFLHTVGNDYLVLYQPKENRYVLGDLYSVRFVEFRDVQQNRNG